MLCYTAEMASEWLDPQAQQKMNYDDMSTGNLGLKTCVSPLLGAFDL